MKTCLNCSFNVNCFQAGSVAMRLIINGISYANGLAFFESKAASCDAFKGTKAPKRTKQLSFKF